MYIKNVKLKVLVIISFSDLLMPNSHAHNKTATKNKVFMFRGTSCYSIKNSILKF